jgi:hypothetical protein
MRRFDDESAAMSAGSSLSRILTLVQPITFSHFTHEIIFRLLI